jgi:hypothetical protein
LGDGLISVNSVIQLAELVSSDVLAWYRWRNSHKVGERRLITDLAAGA